MDTLQSDMKTYQEKNKVLTQTVEGTFIKRERGRRGLRMHPVIPLFTCLYDIHVDVYVFMCVLLLSRATRNSISFNVKE